MAGPKCIMHDSVCAPDEVTQVVVPAVADPWRHFGLWVPPIYLYAFVEPHEHDKNISDLWLFHDSSFVDLAGTIRNLNRLKTEFGFNAISIGVDDFIDVYSWTPFLLFDAFTHPDCLWRLDELFLGLGNGCHSWSLPALRMFRELTNNANVLAVGLDEPLLGNKSFEENGVNRSNSAWCLYGYFDDDPTRTFRIQALYDYINANGDRLIIGESPRVVDFGLLGILGSWAHFRRVSQWADGFIYNGYSIGCAAGSPECTLPIDAWETLQSTFGSPKRSIGVWIANSCHEYYYSPPIAGVRPVCQKDYFNTLLAAVKRLHMRDVFLYGGDLSLELLHTCLDWEDPFRIREPELTEQVVRSILSCGLPFNASDPGAYLSRCPAFREAAVKIFWRRLRQYAQAAREEGILYLATKLAPTGKKLYCTEAPIRTYRGYSVLDCAHCTKWEYSPRGVTFCPPDFWSIATTPMLPGGLPGPRSATNPSTPHVYQSPSAGQLVSKGGTYAFAQPGGAAGQGVKKTDSQPGDEPVPPDQRRYTVRYFIR
ncbi:MAG: hypothetical protein IH600_16835 [Bacteroidetes bacterium]|nr:hypothetical protein [Bacteroidota bacterium]